MGLRSARSCIRPPPTSGSSSRRDGLPLRWSAVLPLTTCSISTEEMLCIHASHSCPRVSLPVIKCNAPHNVYTTQRVVIFDQHEKQGRKNHGDETTAAFFASVHGATLAGRVGQWSDRVARQSAACVQW